MSLVCRVDKLKNVDGAVLSLHEELGQKDLPGKSALRLTEEGLVFDAKAEHMDRVKTAIAAGSRFRFLFTVIFPRISVTLRKKSERKIKQGNRMSISSTVMRLISFPMWNSASI